MLDYTNAGAQASKYLNMYFGVRRLLDSVTSYTLGFWFNRKRADSACGIFMELDNRYLYGVGAVIKIIGGGFNQIAVQHNTVTSALSPAIALNTTYSYLVVWDSVAGLQIFRDGVPWHGDVAFLQVPTVPFNIGLSIGTGPGALLTAPSGYLGNVALWPKMVQTVRDAEMWHAGIMPHYNSCRFYYRGTEVPGRDEYTRDVPDCIGIDISGEVVKLPVVFHDNIWQASDPSDFYYDLHSETPNEQMVILAGEELNRRRLIRKSYQITVPTEFYARELMDDLQLTHKGGLESTGEGFGYGDAPERLARIDGIALSPDDRTINLSMRDMKRQAMSYYDAFRSPYTATARQDGGFRLAPTYASKSTSRDSYAWGQAADGLYHEFGFDQEPSTYEGLLAESKRENYFVNGAFKQEFLGWTTLDTGAGTLTAEAPDVEILHNSITEYAVKMVCGPIPGADWVGIRQAVLGAGPGTNMTLSFIYYAETAGGLQMRISRASDGWYLQTLTGVWAAPNTILYPPLETAHKAPYRYVLPYVFNGNDTYTFDFYSASVADRIIWMYHAQLEEGEFSTSPIIGN